MPEDPDLSFVLCILSGGLAVAAGAFGAMHLSSSLVAVIAFLALLRICWLDDNIANDLLVRDDLPQSYINAQNRQRIVETLLLGRPWGETELSPELIATRMRAEMQVWTAVLFSGGAALMALSVPFGLWTSVTFALGGFVWAFRTADRLSETLWLVECGRSLPREELLRRPGQGPGQL